MQKYFIAISCFFSFFTKTLAQDISVNVYGNTIVNNTARIEKTDTGFVAFGTATDLLMYHFDFEKGSDWWLQLTSTGNTTLKGTTGCKENDSVFVFIGRLNIPSEGWNTVVVKATASGRVVWAKWVSTGADEYPDKIVKTVNGDFLVTVKSNYVSTDLGDLGYQSSIFRITSNGNVLWNKKLDSRTGYTVSTVQGIHELPSGNIVITQNYSALLGLIKISAAGDSVKTFWTNGNFVIGASAYDREKQRLYLVSLDNKVVCLDTSFQVLWSKSISAGSLQSMTSITVVNSNTIAIGGKYANNAYVMNVDSNANVIALYHKNFFVSTPSSLFGTYVIDGEVYSLMGQGFAVSWHQQDLSHSCFNKVNGSAFATANIAAPTFKPGVKLSGSSTSDFISNVFCTRNTTTLPSSNCKSYDLSIQTSAPVFSGTCRNVKPSFYVFNHGVVPITSFTIKVYTKEKLYSKNFAVSAIGTKLGTFVEFDEIYLNNDTNVLAFVVSAPNGQQDGFASNDSGSALYIANEVSIGISGKTSFCPDLNVPILASGPSGTYALYRNGVKLSENTNKQFTIALPGNYYILYKSAAGCLYYSDTLTISHLPAPAKPIITINGSNLETDAVAPFYWYFNNNLIDSNISSITHRGSGNYKVRAVDTTTSCFTESTVTNYNTFIPKQAEAAYLTHLQEGTYKWSGTDVLHIVVYSVDGRKVLQLSIQPQSTFSIALPSGLYLLKCNTNKTAFVKKTWLF